MSLSLYGYKQNNLEPDYKDIMQKLDTLLLEKNDLTAQQQINLY